MGKKGNKNASKKEDFLEAAKEVLCEDINAIIYTDDDIVHAVNEQLPKKKQITRRTLQNWKAQVRDGNIEDESAQAFFTLYKKALRQQKQNLFKEFRNDSQWQKWAWIIERKFDEWNIKHKLDHTTKDNPINEFQVEIVNSNEG